MALAIAYVRDFINVLVYFLEYGIFTLTITIPYEWCYISSQCLFAQHFVQVCIKL